MTKKLVVVAVVLILTVTGVVVSCAPEAEPAVPADFFKGKSIELVITLPPGSFDDLTARMIASHLSGDTGASVIATNRGGAATLEGLNYLYRAEPDGLTLGITADVKIVPNKVLDEPAAEFELEKFSYIMSIDRRLNYLFVSPEGPYQSIADLQAGTDLKVGGATPSGLLCLGGLTVVELLGLDAKVVTGFQGVSVMNAAVQRGEIIGYVVALPPARAGIEAGMVKPLFVLATERDPLSPDVPAITELIDLSGADLELVRLWETAFASSTLLLAPPDVPEDRLAFLRDLANQWAQDEGFRAEIDAIAGAEVQIYLTGEEITQEMLDTAANLEDFQSIFIELIEKYRA